MRFIVCARNREDGETYVVGSTSYADKDAAIDALGRSASLAQLAGRELYVVDLEAGTPIVLVNARPVPAVDDTPLADVDPAPESATDDRADVDPEPELLDEALNVDEIGQRLEESDLWSLVESLDEGDAAEPAVVTRAEQPTPWWLNTPSQPTPGHSALFDFDDVASDPPVEETAATAIDGDSAAPATDQHWPHERVYSLELADAAAEGHDRSRSPRPEPSDEDASLYTDEAAPGSGCEERTPEPLDSVMDDAFDDARINADPPSEVTDMPESRDPSAIFMQVDFDAWTCTDCVFTPTCDRTDDAGPSDCGSFQWRPE